MVSFWSSSSAIQAAAKFDRLRQAENKLLLLAKEYGQIAGQEEPSSENVSIRSYDTHISRSQLPFKLSPPGGDGGDDDDDNDDGLIIHGIEVTDNSLSTPKCKVPLVTLHGYFNGCAYYYRNLVGLSRYYSTVYSLDQLGWGLSSRPDFHMLKDESVETTEDFFVESLEQWRKKNKIDKMILCGHSMGGYMSVAYCERYPERVERLLLLSPVGVPDETDPSFQERKRHFSSTWRSQFFLGAFQTLFQWTTVGSVLRSMSESRAYSITHNYVVRRLPEIRNSEEQTALAEYLFFNAISPGSGEHAIHRILDSNILARKPLKDRIPNLRVKSVWFMYGQTDWMDMSAAVTTQRICESKPKGTAPETHVYMVKDAGHLLMLQNPEETNSILIHAGGGKIQENKMPVLITPGEKDLPDSLLRKGALVKG